MFGAFQEEVRCSTPASKASVLPYKEPPMAGTNVREDTGWFFVA